MESGNFYIIIGCIMCLYLEEPILQVDALSPKIGALFWRHLLVAELSRSRLRVSGFRRFRLIVVKDSAADRLQGK